MKIYKVIYLLLLHMSANILPCEGRPCIALIPSIPAIGAGLAAAAAWSGLGTLFTGLGASLVPASATTFSAGVATFSASSFPASLAFGGTAAAGVAVAEGAAVVATGGAATGMLASSTSLIPGSLTTGVMATGGLITAGTTSATTASAYLLPTSSTAAAAAVGPFLANQAIGTTVVRVGQSATNKLAQEITDPNKLKKNMKNGMVYTAQNKEGIKTQVLGIGDQVKFIWSRPVTTIRLTDDTSEEWRKAKQAMRDWKKNGTNKNRYTKKAEARAGEESSSLSSSSTEMTVAPDVIKKRIKATL